MQTSTTPTDPENTKQRAIQAATKTGVVTGLLLIPLWFVFSFVLYFLAGGGLVGNEPAADSSRYLPALFAVAALLLLIEIIFVRGSYRRAMTGTKRDPNLDDQRQG